MRKGKTLLLKPIAIAAFLLLTAHLKAQQFPQAIVLHDSVGIRIDSTEKIKYHLFPYWHADQFSYAEMQLMQDSSLRIAGTMKDGSVKEIRCTKQEFAQYHYLVAYYCGEIPNTDGDLRLLAVELLFRVAIEAAVGCNK